MEHGVAPSAWLSGKLGSLAWTGSVWKVRALYGLLLASVGCCDTGAAASDGATSLDRGDGLRWYCAYRSAVCCGSLYGAGTRISDVL